ncbi:MAG: 16S rRNA (cytosine(967)-C(5))-methyltransferase RsmB [Burkholderiales bacterium]|nr:16S rRNA (cytosine(967)-C(5))-methyltransferase RsmB [Burkholderiales bacterium]
MKVPADTAAHAPPLWRHLQQTARLVQGVAEGRSLTAQLEAVDPALRAGAQALSFHALRWLGLARALRRQLAPRAPAPALDALLCTALSLLVPDEPLPYPPFTLVDQAVEAAKRDRALRAQAAFVNGCLRRFLRERAALLQAVQDDPVARWNHPRWWIERLERDHPQDWRAILTSAQRPAPMVLRVNLARNTVPEFCQRLDQAGIEARALGAAAVWLPKPLPVSAISGFAEGGASVQSAAAQRAAPLLLSSIEGAAPRVLDACAAPGGKTAHLLELRPDARVTALEIDAGRSRRIADNLARLGLRADVRVADAAAPAAWWDGQPFDAILLDAPCSASGIVRRHPDVRWLRRDSDIAQLAAQQDRLLGALWPLLRPGGVLLYCTCSVFRQEGVERVQAFVAHNTEAVILPAPGHLLPGTGEPLAMVGDNQARDDGFYYALLARRAV